jgi:hypothetical protein
MRQRDHHHPLQWNSDGDWAGWRLLLGGQKKNVKIEQDPGLQPGHPQKFPRISTDYAT